MRLRRGGWSQSTIVYAPAEPCRIEAVVPALHQLADAVVESLEGSASCGPGCGACCRQPVPVTKPEVGHLQDVVKRMPADEQQTVMTRAREAAEEMTQDFEFVVPQDLCQTPKKELRETAIRWFNKGIPCPFLVDERCSIYNDRPLICREYLVSSPPSGCSMPGSGNVKRIRLPVSIWNLVARSATGRPLWVLLPEAIITDLEPEPERDPVELLTSLLRPRRERDPVGHIDSSRLDSPKPL